MDTELLGQGISYYRAKNILEARKIFIDISKKFPDEDLSWIWLATCAPNKNGAIQCLQKAFKLNPTNPNTKTYLLQLGQTEFIKSQEARIIPPNPEPNIRNVVFENNNIPIMKKYGKKFWVLALLGIVFLAIVFLVIINISFGEKTNITAANLSPTEDWRTYPNYVSDIKFGEDWPFKFSEGHVQCYQNGITIDSIEGEFGLTGSTNSLGFINIRDSSQWKDGGWMGKVPLSDFTNYAVNLCQ